MPIAPLAGPVGLYTVSVVPRFLLGSERVGWQGAYFTDIVGAPAGSVDHGHERYCIQRCLHSEARQPLRGGPWRVVQAGFAVWQAGDECRFHWSQGGRSQFLFIAPEHAEAVLGNVPRRLARQGDRELLRARVLELIFDALQADLAQGSPAGPLVGDSLVAAFLAHLAGANERAVGPLRPPARARAIELMEARFAQPITLEELAAEAGVGVRQFSRAFRAATGQSPHQYLLQCRVEHAKGLIAKGLPLADVAQQCGFVDQSQLTRTFARRVGTTPGRYRARLRR
jgi:AraC family transcriptional regulator